MERIERNSRQRACPYACECISIFYDFMQKVKGRREQRRRPRGMYKLAISRRHIITNMSNDIEGVCMRRGRVGGYDLCLLASVGRPA